MSHAAAPPRVLCVGGTDPTGAAGLFADLKTLAAMGVQGSGVVTAVTVQTAALVSEVQPVPASVVGSQMDAAAADSGVDAVKTGMLAGVDVVLAVAQRVERMGAGCRLIVDPVLSSSSGRSLLDAEGRRALVERLLPLTSLVTPNIVEAEQLTGLSISCASEMSRAADYLLAMGAGAVLIKGGHLPGTEEEGSELIDLLRTLDGDEYLLTHPRLSGPGFRGTGCALAAAVAGSIAEGRTLRAAVEDAHEYLWGVMKLTQLRTPLTHAGPLALLHGARTNVEESAAGEDCLH